MQMFTAAPHCSNTAVEHAPLRSRGKLASKVLALNHPQTIGCYSESSGEWRCGSLLGLSISSTGRWTFDTDGDESFDRLGLKIRRTLKPGPLGLRLVSVREGKPHRLPVRLSPALAQSTSGARRELLRHPRRICPTWTPVCSC